MRRVLRGIENISRKKQSSSSGGCAGQQKLETGGEWGGVERSLGMKELF